MEEQILKLLYDYSKKGLYNETKLLEQIIDIVVNSKFLNKYLKKVNYYHTGDIKKKTTGIIKPQDFSCLEYNFQTKIMDVYLDTISKACKQEERILVNDFESTVLESIIYVRYLLHELEHVNQNKVKTEENTLESKIISVSLPWPKKFKISEEMPREEQKEICASLIVRYIMYQTSYEYNPIERMAENFSYKTMIDILKLEEKNFPNIINYLQHEKNKSLIQAYIDYFCPTIKCLELLGEEESLLTFDWYSKTKEQCIEKSIRLYDFDRRINCGLPIEEKKKVEFIKKYGTRSK